MRDALETGDVVLNRPENGRLQNSFVVHISEGLPEAQKLLAAQIFFWRFAFLFRSTR
jgi:hypothetical protein